MFRISVLLVPDRCSFDLFFRTTQQSNEIEVRQIFEEMLFSNERLTVYLRQSISMLSEETADFEYGDSSAEAYEISIHKEIFNYKPAFVTELPFWLPNCHTATKYFKHTIVAALKKQLSSFCRKNCVTLLYKASVTFTCFFVLVSYFCHRFAAPSQCRGFLYPYYSP